MSAALLFRKEVAEARKNAWLGDVQIAQPLPVTIVALVSLALVCSTIAYAGFATYTRRVHASGMLMPSDGLITVASPSAGLVSSAAVAEGARVRKGDLLFVIGLDASSSDGPTQQRVIEHLRQQKSSIELARDLRVTGARVEKQTLAEQIQKTKFQLKHLGEQIAGQIQTVASLRERAQVLQHGVRSGIVRDTEFQNQNYIFNQALSLLGQLEQASLQMDARLSELSGRLSVFDTTLAQDLNQLDRGILQLDQQITETQAKRVLEVHAPADGMLTSIRVHAGEQVAAGVPLLTLLPSSGKLDVHLFVDSSAIGFIHKGERVIMRYAAFPFQRYGLYRGAVTEVTRAPVRPAEEATLVRGPGPGSLYRIVVDPEVAYVDVNGVHRPLEAGMKVEADIAIETRRLYLYLFDPMKHLERSLNLVTGGSAQ
jgi:membrane fusion protein